MRVYQLKINPDTGRPETEQFTLHSQDTVCVLIPDEQIVSRFWEDPRIQYDYTRDRWYMQDSPNPFEELWDGFWTYTRILYDHGQNRWYLERFPFLQVGGLFIRR